MSAQVVMPNVAQLAPRMRLTRRGRFVFFGLPAALLLATLLTLALGALLSPAKASDSSDSTRQMATIVVQPGDTLWNIAERVAPGRDPRDVVGEIASLNGLDASQLKAGQDLFIPSK
ncbi:LysM peptidoglycan-binding domain-containing protein [Arthrobacter sp. NPDC090010]|uniref:LysM peptidoglycan-binding domain-containing protein n=1 Tax=Arthrobacter sp. NPDC090010 TaxID=3363942 RepID=UPI0037F88460